MVEVVPYDSKWSEVFEVLSSQIQLALGQSCLHVYHVGSTAVAGLAAKPKIDIIAEVDDLEFDASGLLDLGYDYRGGYSLPLRKSFTLRGDVAVNLHVFETGDAEIEINLLFRDYLRTHPEERKEYQDLKYRLLEEEDSHHKHGRMYVGYTLKKHDFIQSILKKIGFDGYRFVIAAHDQEMEAVRSFGYDVLSKNTYVLLYKGFEVVGCAEVDTLARKVIRMHCQDDYQVRFERLISKWLAILQ